MDEGLNLHSSLFQKLWRVASIQGHFDPWHPRLLERNEAQLDLILEAYSVDHPKVLKFERRKTREAKERPAEMMRGWADVLIGDAKATLLKKLTFKLPARFANTQPARTGAAMPPRPTSLPPPVTTPGAKSRAKAGTPAPRVRPKPVRKG
jgi:hypothetical protein